MNKLLRLLRNPRVQQFLIAALPIVVNFLMSSKKSKKLSQKQPKKR